MAYVQIEELLQQTMGLDVASIGASAVERAVLARAAECKLDGAVAYLARLRSSAAELQALIEAVVVPETWFFRDMHAYAALVRIAQEEWLRAHPESVLRLLSVPCSTGEEPYSMAMALADAGFPAERYRIDAVDISARCLRRATTALYGRNSFRGRELGFRDRHFDATRDGYRLSKNARRLVHFQQGNLLAEDFLRAAERYDMIFCRNLLIYFDRATQDRAVGVLSRLLTAQGVLFVGPSETGLLLDHGFSPARLPFAFAFRKAEAAPRTQARSPVQSIRHILPVGAQRNLAVPAKGLSGSASRPIRAAAPSAPAVANPAPATLMAEALRLADQGRIVEAARLCEEQLRRNGPSVEVFHLLGLVRAAAGNLHEAQEYYRKALYLDQNHHDSLLHLALVREKQGDAAGAEVLRDRLRRLRLKSAK